MPIQHGVTPTNKTSGIRAISTVSTAVIGMLAYADDADASVFPLNTAVLLTDPLAGIAAAGETGTLATSLDAISDHVIAPTVVVRVEEGEDEAATSANIVAGMEKLRSAKTQLGVTPRILGVPGADTQVVTAGLVTVAQELNGFIYASAWGATTKEQATAYRDNFGDREVMIIWPDFKNGDDSISAVGRALGLRAKLDTEQGWHKSLSNVVVNGVTGITQDVSWALTKHTTDAAYLNENQVTTLIREQGFRFWGNRTCSAEPLYAFEVATRTSQVLEDTMAEAHLWAIDKPLTKTLAFDILEGIKLKLRSMVTAERLIGANAWIDPAKNTEADIASGKLLIEYDFTPVPPLENLALEQTITSSYLATFASSLAA